MLGTLSGGKGAAGGDEAGGPGGEYGCDRSPCLAFCAPYNNSKNGNVISRSAQAQTPQNVVLQQSLPNSPSKHGRGIM